jgi:acyl-CoA synthetase (AMP-forming)/AMP-acid ligase II
MIDAVLRHRDDSPALIAPAQGVHLTYADLGARVDEVAERLLAMLGERRLVFLVPGPDVGAVLLYLGCLRARLPVCLAEPQTDPLARLSRVYQPALVLAPAALAIPDGWRAVVSPVPGYVAALSEGYVAQALHPDLALLLTTSGSTGSPKLVRLTARNLEANARAIAEYLNLGPGERAVQSLPMHYSYGLSVLNSHLVAGGTVVLTPHSFMRPEFWRDADEEHASSFAGVPYMYETLQRLRFDPARHPSLRTLTQAGGALRRDLIAHFHARASSAGARLVIMYGQTEATARISYVPPERLGDKIGTIGVAIPGGRLWLEPLEGGESSVAQLVYQGGNVMMGYAETIADLGLGDVLHGVLRTGDLGTVDDEGFFTVVGRLQRFAKLFGRRVSLEDVERELEAAFPVRAIATDAGDRLGLYVAVDGAIRDDALVTHVARFLAVPPASIVLRRVAELPLTSAGKKDYRSAQAAR